MILVKRHSSIQLAHLYEHLFCGRANNLFYENGLFPYLDYSIAGRTYHQGIIFIKVETYRSQADTLGQQIQALNIDTSKNNVTNAISQLLAEEEVLFGSLGYEAIKKELEELDKQVWQDLDEVGVIDLEDVQKTLGPLYIANGKALRARKLKVNIGIESGFIKNHRELTPFFRQISISVNANLRVGLTERFGYYSAESKYLNATAAIGMENIFHVANSQPVSLESIIGMYFSELSYLKQCNAFERLLSDLKNISYTDRLNFAHSAESNFEDTHFFVGAKGWKDLASKKNCDDIMKHLLLSVSFGQKKIKVGIDNQKR